MQLLKETPNENGILRNNSGIRLSNFNYIIIICNYSKQPAYTTIAPYWIALL